MTTKDATAELARIRETLAKNEADHVTLKAKVRELEDARLLALPREFGLADTKTLIARLRAVARGAKKSGPARSAADKAAIRADIAAKLPDEEIYVNFGFGGTGILTSFISGYLLANWLKGKEKEYQKYFKLER